MASGERKNAPACRGGETFQGNRRRRVLPGSVVPKKIGSAMQKSCAVCGKPFELKIHNQLTCSPDCAHVRHLEQLRAYRGNGTPRCVVCGAPFKREHHHGRQITCSEDCRIVRRAQICRDNNLRTAKPVIVQVSAKKEVPCLRCGKPFKSESKENRICRKCTNLNAILDARTYMPLYDIAISTSKARRAGA